MAQIFAAYVQFVRCKSRGILGIDHKLQLFNVIKFQVTCSVCLFLLFLNRILLAMLH